MKPFDGGNEVNNDKHVVVFVVAHFVYLSNDEKEVNVFFLGIKELICEHISEQW